MEKLDYLLFGTGELPREQLLALPGVRGLTVQQADATLPGTILLGDGPRLGALVQVWLHAYEQGRALETLLRPCAEQLDGYLVTESEPVPLSDRDWPDGTDSPGLSHVTWFPKPGRLTEQQFLHGWHEVHSPHSAALHPRRWTYVRDTVVRTLTAGSPPVRAIVVERFRSLQDYADPARLFGGKAAFEQNLLDLPGYADLADISSRPMRETVLRTA